MITLMLAAFIPPLPPEPTTAPVPAVVWSCTVARANGKQSRFSGRFGRIEASPEHPVVGLGPEWEVTFDDSNRLTGKHPAGDYWSGNYINSVDRGDIIYWLAFHFQDGRDTVEIASARRPLDGTRISEHGTCTVLPEGQEERG